MDEFFLKELLSQLFGQTLKPDKLVPKIEELLSNLPEGEKEKVMVEIKSYIEKMAPEDKSLLDNFEGILGKLWNFKR